MENAQTCFWSLVFLLLYDDEYVTELNSSLGMVLLGFYSLTHN